MIPRRNAVRALSAILLCVSASACSKLTEPPKPEPLQEGAPTEIKAAQTAAAQPAPTPTPTPTPAAPPADPNAKLEIKDLVVGKGAEAKAGDNVKVHYVGTLLNGTEFDASRKHGNDPFQFALGQGRVIKGWDQGVAGMKEGGKRKLVIPPSLGYGERGAGATIPPNSTLVFEVELLEVVKKK
jgi:FKBP-type peptidyl-prolyl cis-trans isomerase